MVFVNCFPVMSQRTRAYNFKNVLIPHDDWNESYLKHLVCSPLLVYICIAIFPVILDSRWLDCVVLVVFYF